MRGGRKSWLGPERSSAMGASSRAAKTRYGKIEPLLSGLSTGLVSGSAAAAALPDITASLANLDPQDAIGLATFVGLVMFATATAVLYLREHRKWAERERMLSAQLAELRDVKDRAELLTG